MPSGLARPSIATEVATYAMGGSLRIALAALGTDTDRLAQSESAFM